MTAKIAIIGAGPAGLMAALRLAQGKAGIVTVYDQMPSPARKFLMAGRGGLNLTHSRPMPQFLQAYGPQKGQMTPALAGFSPQDLREFAASLGEETFVGTSGRVFPKSFKASPMLRNWLKQLDFSGVQLKTRHRWLGWSADGLRFATPQGEVTVQADATLLALGGGSWAKLGSDGQWAPLLQDRGVGVAALEAANCGFDIGWSTYFVENFSGSPLKNIIFSSGSTKLRGETILTSSGIEGSAIYALSAVLRAAFKTAGHAELTLDLRPDKSEAELSTRIKAAPKGQSLSSILRKTGLGAAEIALLREVLGKDLPKNAEILAKAIKTLTLRLVAPRPIDRAISTAGGVQFQELDAMLMLKRLPGVFVAGEMLDFDAPTGGYLLQAAFSTGVLAARGIERWLKRS